MNEKFELLAPAGDLEKLKVAILYGANAVFIGGLRFSLRSRASNFTISDIKEGCSFAHSHNAKVHVTCNIVMHENDTLDILEYLKALEEAGVDAIIASSIAIMKLVIENTKMEVHVSTQASTLNFQTVEFYQKFGAKRVVLARELSLDEIKEIKDNTNIDLEVFIHGGMCVSYSGRCMLSNNMTNRDANRGGCAHSCRWNYNLYQNDKKISNNLYFQMGSKDLCAIEAIPYLMDLGINSFKIEGRMKSLHYIATVVNTYRKLIDEYKLNHKISDFTKYYKQIEKAENRVCHTGFLFHDASVLNQLYDEGTLTPTKDFVGIVTSYDENTKMAYVEQRNFFLPNSTIEVFSPTNTFNIDIKEIYDLDDNLLDACRHPQQKIKFKCDVKLKPYDLLRLC